MKWVCERMMWSLQSGTEYSFSYSHSNLESPIEPRDFNWNHANTYNEQAWFWISSLLNFSAVTSRLDTSHTFLATPALNPDTSCSSIRYLINSIEEPSVVEWSTVFWHYLRENSPALHCYCIQHLLSFLLIHSLSAFFFFNIQEQLTQASWPRMRCSKKKKSVASGI